MEIVRGITWKNWANLSKDMDGYVSPRRGLARRSVTQHSDMRCSKMPRDIKRQETKKVR